MSLSICREHLECAARILSDPLEMQNFLQGLRRKYPEFVERLEKLLTKFLGHVDIHPHDAYRRNYANTIFTKHACWILAPLLLANLGELPGEILHVYDEISGDCSSEDRIRDRETVLGALNSDWIMCARVSAQQLGICFHVTGPLYALADAFLEAKKIEEGQKTLSEDVAERMKNLSLGIDKSLEGIDFTLPSGEKNIGEE